MSVREKRLECEAVTHLTVDDAVLGVVQGRAVPSLSRRDGGIRVEVRHVVELNDLM